MPEPMLRQRQAQLQQGFSSTLATLAPWVAAQIRTWEADGLIRRLWQRDPALWSADPSCQERIAQRLGWLTLTEGMAAAVDALTAFGRAVPEAGFRNAVLLGMGGSSLCSEVLHQVLGVARGYPRFSMLDSTDPGAVQAVAESVDLPRTLFVVASKSGTTVEPLAFYHYFRERLTAAGVSRPGEHFVAITDPGTPLTELAAAAGFRRTFLSAPDVGGRYSALSHFGLVPAALMGADLADLLAWGRAMAELCGPQVPLSGNPGVELGAILAQAAAHGRNKVTFIVDPPLTAFGLWLEQLLAESTGKAGTGLIPIVGEAPGEPTEYGGDRCFVHITLGGQGHHAGRVAALEAAGHPVVHVNVPEPTALGAEFLRWEIATAVAGVSLGINPFDEPDVRTAKDGAKAVLATLAATGRMPASTPRCSGGGLTLFYDEVTRAALPASPGDPARTLAAALQTLRPGDYVGLLAYTPPTAAVERRLGALRTALRQRYGIATTFGFGPRYLHSTGQLYKGGPHTGFFLVFTVEHGGDQPIPGAGYSFGQLELAQALGDLAALEARGRPAVRLHLPDAAWATLDAACFQIEQAIARD